jgi:hypothetical protein
VQAYTARIGCLLAELEVTITSQQTSIDVVPLPTFPSPQRTRSAARQQLVRHAASWAGGRAAGADRRKPIRGGDVRRAVAGRADRPGTAAPAALASWWLGPR